MTLALQPPPLQIPPALAQDQGIAKFFNSLINTLYQIWTALYSLQTQSKVTTTNASNTAIFIVNIPLNQTVMITANVCAHRTGGSAGSANDSGFYQIFGAYKNNGGTLAGIGTPVYSHGGDQAAWGISLTTSGTTAIVQVTGAANNNITWQGTLSTITAGA